LRKDARLKKAQAQAGGISVVAAVDVSEVAAASRILYTEAIREAGVRFVNKL
jgi:hypothetical protein